MRDIQKLDENSGTSMAINTVSNPLMEIVHKMSTDKEIDLDRVERAFSMYKEVRAMDAEQSFNLSMAQAQSEINCVIANQRNDHTKSSFADLSAIHESAKPIWTKYGFSVVTKTQPSEIANHIKVICEVRHKDGHKEINCDDWPLDQAGAKGGVNKTAIQAKGSSTQYARRYTELMIFDIAIKGEDDGNAISKNLNAAEQPLTAAQVDTLRQEIVNAGATEEALCARAGIERIQDLQQGRLAGCIRALKSGARK